MITNSLEEFLRRSNVPYSLYCSVVGLAGDWRAFTESYANIDHVAVQNAIYKLNDPNECETFVSVNLKHIVPLMRTLNVSYDMRDTDFFFRTALFAIKYVCGKYAEFNILI